MKKKTPCETLSNLVPVLYIYRVSHQDDIFIFTFYFADKLRQINDAFAVKYSDVICFEKTIHEKCLLI